MTSIINSTELQKPQIQGMLFLEITFYRNSLGPIFTKQNNNPDQNNNLSNPHQWRRFFDYRDEQDRYQQDDYQPNQYQLVAEGTRRLEPMNTFLSKSINTGSALSFELFSSAIPSLGKHSAGLSSLSIFDRFP